MLVKISLAVAVVAALSRGAPMWERNACAIAAGGAAAGADLPASHCAAIVPRLYAVAIQRQRPAEARAVLLALPSRDPLSNFALGVRLHAAGDRPAAVAAWQAAGAEPYFSSRAERCRAAGDFACARAHAETAASIAPGIAGNHYLLGDLIGFTQPDAAAAAFRRAIALDGDVSLRRVYGAAMAAYLAGDYPGAAQALREGAGTFDRSEATSLYRFDVARIGAWTAIAAGARTPAEVRRTIGFYAAEVGEEIGRVFEERGDRDSASRWREAGASARR